MAGALKDAEVNAPWADSFAILVGQQTRELMKMGQVVNDPGSEELTEGNGAEGGMAAAAIEILRLEVHCAELDEAVRAYPSEFVQQLRQ